MAAGEGAAAELAVVRRTAVAVRILLKAAVALDDIQDGSDVRYGEPALHTVHGTPLALNAGAWLIMSALRHRGRPRPSWTAWCARSATASPGRPSTCVLAYGAHPRGVAGRAARRPGRLLGGDGRPQDRHPVPDAARRGGRGTAGGRGRPARPGRRNAPTRPRQPAVQRPDRLRTGTRRRQHPRGLRRPRQPGPPGTPRRRTAGSGVQTARSRSPAPGADAARARRGGRGPEARREGHRPRGVPLRAQRRLLRRHDRTQGPPHRPSARDGPAAGAAL
ncbi:polyprenyl synthetase family protein [Streptomyces sp. L7]